MEDLIKCTVCGFIFNINAHEQCTNCELTDANDTLNPLTGDWIDEDLPTVDDLNQDIP